MRIMELIAELKEFANRSQNIELASTLDELRDQVLYCLSRRDEALTRIDSFHQQVSRLHTSLANTQRLLMIPKYEDQSFLLALGDELGCLREVAAPFLNPDRADGPRRHQFQGSLRDQITKVFNASMIRIFQNDIPESLPPVTLDPHWLSLYDLGRLINHLTGSDESNTLGIVVSAVLLEGDSHQHIVVSIRGPGNYHPRVFQQSFAFPAGKIDTIPEFLLQDLLRCDIRIRKLGGRFSLIYDVHQGPTFTLKFPIEWSDDATMCS